MRNGRSGPQEKANFSLTLVNKIGNTKLVINLGESRWKKLAFLTLKPGFPNWFKRVNQTGQSIMITNRGKPVAEIVPARKSHACQMTREEAFAQVARLWETVEPMTKEEIKQTIKEGRDRCPNV